MKFSKLFSILLALIFILAMLPTAFAAEAVSSVTFVTTPEDAAVTLNGVTKQASGGTVTFEVADGTYECQVSATGYVWQEGTVTVSGNAAYSVTLAEDTAKSYWTFDTDAEGWTCGNTVDTLSHVDGALKLQMTSNDPIIVKTGVNLDMTGRDRAVLTYKKENASESSFLLYFKSIVNGTTYGNSGARALTKTLPATTDGFVTTVFEANEYFAGTLVDLRVDPIPTAANLTGATFYMDKLEIPKIAQLELAVSSATLVTFNVSPEDAAVTLNGVTKQASGGVASFSVSDGTYDCQVSATGYVWQEGTVTVSGSAAYSVILTEDSEKSYWTFDSDVEGWSNRNTTADTLSHSDGALKLEMTSNDPGVTKNGVNLDMTARDRVVITYKKENAGESELLLYFKSIVDGATYDLAEARALKKTLPATTEGFVTTVLEANEYFAGTLENLRLDPVTTAQNQTGAVFYLDKLEIPKVESLSIISENECYLEFSVSPATADVSLFGEDAALVGEKRAVDGKAGFIVSKGNYTYTVEKFGYEVFEGSVTAGQDTTVDVSLTPLSEYYSYDFSQKASVAQIMEDGWNISSPETLVIDESYGIQTGVAGVENVFSYMLEEAIDHGTIELSLEVMGSVPVEGGYFDASLRPTPDSTIFCFYVTNADGDVFQYKTPNNATQALSGKYDFTGELHTLDFVIDLDTGSLKIRHDDTVILEYADYGNKTGGNTFAGLYMHFKPDCEFYWKSVRVSHSDEVVPTEMPRWIDQKTEPGDFSIVVLGDTQILPLGSPNTLALMAQWVKENKDKENIQYVIHVGDVTGNNQEAGWKNFTDRFNILDGEVPMAVVPGNHDYEGLDPWGGADVGKEQEFRSLDRFNRFIPYEKVSTYPTFGGAYQEGRTENLYHLFHVGNLKYMILALEFAPRDSVVEWANEVVASHPDYNVIVTTHGYMEGNGTLYSDASSHPLERYLFIRNEEDDCNNGQKLWDKLLKKHENIFLVLNGHSAPVDVRRRVDLGDNGNQVFQFCVDSTQLDRGDYDFSKFAGMMLQMRFREDGTKIDCNYYSAFYGKYYRQENQFTVEVPASQVVYDTDTSVSYYIDGEKAESASLEKREYILSDGEVSVVADNPSENTVISAVYENKKMTGVNSSNDENVNMSLSANENSVIKTFVLDGVSNITPTEAPYILSRDGYAKVTFTGTEETIAKMKNMTTGKTYYDFKNIPYGLYEYTVEKEGYVSQTGYITVSEDITIDAVLNPDDEAHHFSFTEGFDVLSEGATSYAIEDGVGLSLQSGAYIENNSLELDITNRSKIALTYRNLSPYTDLQIQFKIKGSDTWTAYPGIINGYCTDFKTTVLDLKDVLSFNGTLEGLRFGLVTGTDTAANIELRSVTVTACDEVDYISGNHISFQCNTEGAKITLTDKKLGRSYEQITQEADGIVDFGEMLLGEYEYIIYKPGYTVQRGTINLTADTPVLQVTLTEDNQAEGDYRWDFEDSVEEFTACNANSTTVRHEDGCLVVTATGADPYAYTQNMTAKELGNRKMVVINYKNQGPYTAFTMYYVTSVSGGYNKKEAAIKNGMNYFENMYIDLSDVSDWDGNLTQLRLDPEGTSGMEPADFYVDSIELVSVETVNY